MVAYIYLRLFWLLPPQKILMTFSPPKKYDGAQKHFKWPPQKNLILKQNPYSSKKMFYAVLENLSQKIGGAHKN